MATKHYDCVVIGSGQSGSPLASAFAKAGKKTALVEREHVGGCCINEGCTPTKTMIASGRVAYLARRGPEYGVQSTGEDGKLKVDMAKVRQRKRDIVDSFRGGSEKRLPGAGVELVKGEARFQDAKTIKVKLNDGSEDTLSAETLFINVGERPVKPKLDGLDSVPMDRVLDSTSVQELGEVPEHLVVLGGGYVGLEFGQLFRRLGAEVTVVQRGPQLLPREDPDVAESMLQILREDGLTIHLETSATSLSSSSSHPVELAVRPKAGGTGQTIHGSHILFAAGRVPNTDALDLAAAGIATDAKGYVKVSPQLQTSVPHVYALGDATGPPAFTHVSYDDFRVLNTNLLDQTSASAESSKPRANAARAGDDPRNPLAYVVYTDPQLGHVGWHEAEARKRRKNVRVASMPMAWVARALETDESRGMMKAMVDADTDEILGFTCLGLEGGEVMAVVQVAMMGGLPWPRLQDAVFAHPSLAESLNNLWGNLK